MRREGHDDLAAGGQRKLLVELGHVAVMADAVGMEPFGYFREQHFLACRPARSGHARLGVDHDLVRLDRLGFEERDQRQLGATRIAARIGDQLRRLDLRPIDFAKPVNRFFSAARWPHADGRTSEQDATEPSGAAEEPRIADQNDLVFRVKEGEYIRELNDLRNILTVTIVPRDHMWSYDRFEAVF